MRITELLYKTLLLAFILSGCQLGGIKEIVRADFLLEFQHDTIHTKAEIFPAETTSPEKKIECKRLPLLLDKADALYKEANCPAALELYETILTDAKNCHGEEYAALFREARRKTGNCFYKLGRYVEAKRTFEELLPEVIKAEGQESAKSLSVSRNLAGACSELGEYAKALKIYKQILESRIKKDGPEAKETLDDIYNLATIYMKLGEYGHALDLFEQNLQSYLKLFPEDHPDVTMSRIALAHTLIELGMFAQALELYEKNLQVLNKNDPKRSEDLAYTYIGLAAVYSRRDNKSLPKAGEFFFKVAQIREKTLGKNHPLTLHSLLNYAKNIQEQKNYEKAGRLYDGIIEGFKKNSENDSTTPFLLEAQLVKGDLLTEAGKAAEACDLLLSILPEVRANDDLHTLFHLNNVLRKAWQANSNSDMAVFFGKQAVFVGQKLRKNLKKAPKEVQKSFSREVAPAYRGLASLLLSLNRVDEAQQVMSLLKLDELEEVSGDLDSLGTDKESARSQAEKLFGNLDGEIIRHYQEMGDKLVNLNRKRRELLDKKNSGQKLDAAEEALLQKISEELIAVRQVLSSFLNNLGPELAKHKQAINLGETESYQRLLAEMGGETVLLQTVTSEQRVWIILISAESFLVKESPLKAHLLPNKVHMFRGALQDPEEDPRLLGKEIYDALIAPIAESLWRNKPKVIMFSLDGAWRYIPMAALYDGEKWLIQKCAVTIFNDASKAGLAKAPAYEWRVAGLGVTKGHNFQQGNLRGTFSPLPAVKGELMSVVKSPNSPDGILPGYIIFDEGFTSTALSRALVSEHPIIHLASHFHFDARNPELSFLLLGDGSGLNLKRIGSKEFDFTNVGLLALSACQTARGGVDATGKEIEGFGALAQNRGAKTVLATLWPVFDESTGLLMADFYRLYTEEKLTIAESLREAQLIMLENRSKTKDFRHPSHWAPFVLMGDWR